MRKLLLFTTVLVVALGGVALLAQAMDLETALSFFVNDQIMIEYSDAGKAQLEEIIVAMKVGVGAPDNLNEDSEEAVGALVIDLSLKEVVNKLSQAYYTLANVFTENDEEGYPIFRAGKHWGFKSLRMNPEFNDQTGGRFDDSVAAETDIRALYWMNANWLRASKENKMAAVFAGVPAKSEMLTNRVLGLDPTFTSGGPYRSFGGYYEQLPGLFGRDVQLALYYLCHVVDEPDFCSGTDAGEMVPDASAYFENRTFFAEYYLMPEGHWEDAARVLQSVLDDEIGETYTLMNAYSQAYAQQLLEEVSEHL
ncbi:MAG: hypothetical protein E4H08_02225 [Candidatus Atribacteria bacterium]|jgi:hypothetical protein|nr:MAG: hypothetical protein E4H08_02225 [Candidatus Atribacteria bacterium]